MKSGAKAATFDTAGGGVLGEGTALLVEAETMLGVGLNTAAGRTAYLAGFHAAQALIFERDGKVLKTHRGVIAEFLKLTKDDQTLKSSDSIVPVAHLQPQSHRGLRNGTRFRGLGGARGRNH